MEKCWLYSLHNKPLSQWILCCVVSSNLFTTEFPDFSCFLFWDVFPTPTFSLSNNFLCPMIHVKRLS